MTRSAGGADLLTACASTATSVGTGILTAAITTALAFYAAMLADFGRRRRLDRRQWRA